MPLTQFPYPHHTWDYIPSSGWGTMPAATSTRTGHPVSLDHLQARGLIEEEGIEPVPSFYSLTSDHQICHLGQRHP